MIHTEDIIDIEIMADYTERPGEDAHVETVVSKYKWNAQV